MITAIVGTIVLLLVFAVVVAVAREPGPSPEDVAVAYELAWDRLDFESLFTLSGTELRDGLDRREFITAKRAAYRDQGALGGLAERVGVDDSAVAGRGAIVATRVELRDGGVLLNRVDLARRNGRWEVVGYRLTPTDEDSNHA